jgi:hypothetical protein
MRKRVSICLSTLTAWTSLAIKRAAPKCGSMRWGAKMHRQFECARLYRLLAGISLGPSQSVHRLESSGERVEPYHKPRLSRSLHIG